MIIVTHLFAWKGFLAFGQRTPNNMISTDAARYPHLISSLIYPLTARVFGVPQMILQPVSSIFPVLHCPLGPGELTIPLYPLYVYWFSTSRSPISPRGPAIKLIWTYDTDQVFFHCSFFCSQVAVDNVFLYLIWGNGHRVDFSLYSSSVSRSVSALFCFLWWIRTFSRRLVWIMFFVFFFLFSGNLFVYLIGEHGTE